MIFLRAIKPKRAWTRPSDFPFSLPVVHNLTKEIADLQEIEADFDEKLSGYGRQLATHHRHPFAAADGLISCPNSVSISCPRFAVRLGTHLQ